MKYFKIKEVESDKVKAVVLHDSTKSYFSIHSISDALQLAIDSSVKVLRDVRLIKTNERTLKALKFDLNNPFWASLIIKKALGDESFWKLSEEGTVVNVTEIDSFLAETLQ